MQGQQPNYDIRQILSNEYSRKQSWYEFKQALDRSRSQIPLFTKYLLAVRFVLYWVSWITGAPNEFMMADPDLTFKEMQMWRIVLSPLVVTSFWFDIILVMPVYLCFFSYTREFHTGTLTACIYFNLISKSNFSFSLPNPVYFLLQMWPYSASATWYACLLQSFRPILLGTISIKTRPFFQSLWPRCLRKCWRIQISPLIYCAQLLHKSTSFSQCLDQGISSFRMLGQASQQSSLSLQLCMLSAGSTF